MQLITVTRVDVKLKNNSSRSSGLIDKMRFLLHAKVQIIICSSASFLSLYKGL